MEGMSTFWGGRLSGITHPQPPFHAPNQTKRVPICSLLNSASICILIKTWNWIVAELWGKNWGTDAHAHMTYQAPTPGLHSPSFHFFKIPLTISCWHNPGSLEWIAAPVAWLTPRPAPERVCLWLLDMSTTPPLSPSLLKKGGNWLGLS